MPWWAWVSFVALDAPTVAVAWSWFVARESGNPADTALLVIVGLSVWLAYMADRLLDARRLVMTAETVKPDAAKYPGSLPTRRHAFAMVYGSRLAVVWFVVLLVDVALAAGILSGAALVAGCCIVLLAAVTLGCRLRASVIGVVVRSLLIGCAFAGAVAITIDPELLARVAPALAAFAAVCAANVTSVARWERGLQDGVDIPLLRSRIPVTMTASALVVAIIAWQVTGSIPALGAGIAALLLLSLHAASRRLGTDALRLCADACLVVPLVLLS